MEDFITEAIDKLNAQLEEKYGSIFWYLDTDYEEGEPAYLLGRSVQDNEFIDVSIYPEGEVKVYTFDGEDWFPIEM